MPDSPSPLRVPFLEAHRTGGEPAAMAEALASGEIGGDGPFTRRVEAFLAEKIGAPRVLLTDSADSALEIALRLLELEPGDEVILPAFNYMPAANACLACGLVPVFADCEGATLNLDPAAFAASIGARTRAVMPAAYGGVGGRLASILQIAESCGLAVIEDAALGFGASWRGRPLGTLGDFGVYCFQQKRHVHGGEAGALVLRDGSYAAKAERLRERGTNRQQLLRGEAAVYAWSEPGRVALASDLAAAFLWAQLQELETTLDRLRGHCSRYRQGLAEFAAAGRIVLPAESAEHRGNGHLFYLLLPDEKRRDALAHHLRDAGIVAGSHYSPLHLEPAAAHLGYRPGDAPVAENASRRLLRLPVFVNLRREQQDRVIAETRRFLEKI